MDRSNLQKLVEGARSALDGVAIDQLTIPQIEKLTKAGVATLAPVATREQFAKRVDSASEAKTVDGAVAATLRPIFLARPNGQPTQEAMEKYVKDSTTLIVAAAKHPSLADAFKAGRGEWILLTMNGSDPEDLKKGGVYAAIVPLIKDSLPASFAGPALAFHEAVTGEGMDVLDDAAKKTLRTSVLAIAAKALADPKLDPQEKEYIKYSQELLNGAAARGELIGYPAPPIHFIWSTAKPEIKSFADLKGKIVVVDFWATWCGPCIASFPHMRELVDKYKDQPVVILGVTSPQGYVVYPKAKDPKERKVDTKEQKDELERMPAWVKEMDMTWTVAVSTENCFNPDFGVQGIPAMAIIDAKGIVRFNKLSPRSNEVVEDIDTLLKEMKDGAPAEKDKKAADPKKPAKG